MLRGKIENIKWMTMISSIMMIPFSSKLSKRMSDRERVTGIFVKPFVAEVEDYSEQSSG